ncbi:MAG: ABC transporter permease, partial [Eubacteriales bacterium]
CVAIWNGCFNSIQSVCRERAIIKREHRSGMHISAYMAAHMIYQFMLCAAQTALTMFVLRQLNVQIPRGYGSGLITPWMICDIGITMFLISYASDMMSLFLSSISRTTTGAMTLMPFILIFQLVFSGGIIPLPEWSRPISNFTISNYGIKALTAQSGYNELPMTTVWNTVSGMRDTEVGGTFTVGELLDKLDNPVVDRLRDREVLKAYTVGEVAEILSSADEYLRLREKEIVHPISLGEIVDAILTEDAFRAVREKNLIAGKTVGDLLESIRDNKEAAALLDIRLGKTLTLGQVLDALHAEELVSAVSDKQLNQPVTVGTIVDFLKNNEALAGQRDKAITLKTTVGEVMDLFGEENVKSFIQEKTAAAAHKDEYENSVENIAVNWAMLFLFIAVFAILATVVLELIDKDKR